MCCLNLNAIKKRLIYLSKSQIKINLKTLPMALSILKSNSM